MHVFALEETQNSIKIKVQHTEENDVIQPKIYFRTVIKQFNSLQTFTAHELVFLCLKTYLL